MLVEVDCTGCMISGMEGSCCTRYDWLMKPTELRWGEDLVLLSVVGR